MTIYDFFIQPFSDHAMRRAMVCCASLCFAGCPLGVFLVLRRMSLMGDAMSHGILSGVALAFLISGTALMPMALGGLVAGLIIAALSGLVSRITPLKEDASLTGMYMISLALAVLILSGDTDELESALFGDVFKISDASMWLSIGMSSLGLFALTFLYRGLIVECFDAGFLKSVKGHSNFYQQAFLVLVVCNLVAAFQAMGMLMALGLMILPAISARLWARTIDATMLTSIGVSLLSAISGLLIAYHYPRVPSGASIVLSAGAVYLFSIVFGFSGGLIPRLFPHRHLTG